MKIGNVIDNRFSKYPLSALIFLFFTTAALYAQPSPSQLADQLDQVISERIQNIDRLQITTVVTGGMFEGTESVTSYEKVNRDGRYVLEPVDTDDYDMSELSGNFDEMMGEMVRHASLIENETYQGRPVYRITVDDQEFLSQFGGPAAFADDEFNEMDEEFTPEAIIFYLDRDEMIMHKSTFYQQMEGQGRITVHIVLSDYQNHSGMPIPHVMELEIEGLDDMVSEEELQQARQGMAELKAQLENMPQAQRDMIERQLMPQIERFEQMIAEGELGNIRVEVKEVVVN